MADKTGGSIGKIEFHAPYHPNVTIRVLDKYYSVDAACSNKSDKYIHWLTHFHFDHIRSSVAGGADFLLKQHEKITIFAPDDSTPVNGETDVFGIHKYLYLYHSKKKRILVPVQNEEKIKINGSIIEAVSLKHSIPNNALFIKNKRADFTVMVTGDWMGSNEENREKIASKEPSILITECRYFTRKQYAMSCERMHTHLEDILELRNLMPETLIIPYHISRTFSNILPIKQKLDKHNLIFGKKILFYDNIKNFDITEAY
ncbi:MAG: hypothetical protein ACXQTP_04040 [Candidatus Methanofastidiosia archaeon]